LRTKGYEACSTNAVAVRAGVSIGSLYQYFPSKEALITALAREHADRGLAQLHRAIEAAARERGPIAETVREYIRGMIALHQVDPLLHQVLTEQVPRISASMDVVREVSQRSAEMVRLWLETHRDHFRPLDLDAATFVLVTAVEALAHVGVVERPAHLRGEGLVDELSELVLRYLGVRADGRR
jgi:AcrR family transcriptional regulator